MEKKGGVSRGRNEGWKEGGIRREMNKGWKGKDKYAKEWRRDGEREKS
jgi:hypothetical protein